MATKTSSQPFTSADLPRLMTTAQTAEYLNVSECTLRNWRSRDEGPDYALVGGRALYLPEDIDAWRRGQMVRTRHSMVGA